MAASAGALPDTLTSAPGQHGLIRGIGRWSQVAMMVNGIIGAGIFGLPSHVHALIGVYGLLAYAVCAALVLCIGLCFAEVSSRFTATGGPYLYTRAAFGPVPGFLMGWLMWITRVTALATIANVMASYFAFFWPAAAAGWPRAAVMSAALIALTILNLVGVRRVARTVNVLTVAKLAPLAVFIVVGLFALDRHAFAATPIPPAGAFSQAIFQLIFAFGGFEAAAVAAGEMQDPRRNVPFALLFALAITTVFYILIQTVCIGTLPGLAASERPLADASARFMGSAGGTAIALGALISTVSTLCASLMLGSRLLFAMSEQDQLPGVFERIQPRFRTPHVAILVTAATGLALTLSGTFTYVLGLNVIARLATFVFTAGALIVFRRRGTQEPARFPVPGGEGLAILGIATCLWLVTRSGSRELRDVAIAVAAGAAIYAAHRWSARRRPAVARP